jgi:hypothetical protein
VLVAALAALATTPEVAAAIPVLGAVVVPLAAATLVGTGALELCVCAGVRQFLADQTDTAIVLTVAAGVLLATAATPVAILAPASIDFADKRPNAGRGNCASGQATQRTASRCCLTERTDQVIKMPGVHAVSLRFRRAQFATSSIEASQEVNLSSAR